MFFRKLPIILDGFPNPDCPGPNRRPSARDIAIGGPNDQGKDPLQGVRFDAWLDEESSYPPIRR